MRGNLTDQEFGYYLLFTSFFERQVEALMGGSNYPAINSKDMRLICIPIPNKQERMIIGKRMQQLQLTIDSSHNEREFLMQLKSGLMQDLLTGKIPVSE